MGWSGPMTQRQYVVWQVWLDLQWNRPSRSDVYLMQVACQVTRAGTDKPKLVELPHFILKFETPTDKPSSTTRDQASAFGKAKWLGQLGVPVVEQTKTAEQVKAMTFAERIAASRK